MLFHVYFFFLLNTALKYLCNSHSATYSIFNTLKFYHKCDSNTIDIKQNRLNSQQFCSSSPLLQWLCPSHRKLNQMHWPFLHRNHVSGQVFDAERYNIMISTRTAGVAISPQRPSAVILTASPKTRFCWYMRDVIGI